MYYIKGNKNSPCLILPHHKGRSNWTAKLGKDGGIYNVSHASNLLEANPKKYSKELKEVLSKYPDGKLPPFYDFEDANYSFAALILNLNSKSTVPDINANEHFVDDNDNYFNAKNAISTRHRKTLSDLKLTNKETRIKKEQWTRLFQKHFRKAAKEENNKCIITGNGKSNMIEAFHIKPFSKYPQPNTALDIANGGMMQTSLHRPFDDSDFTIKDSKVLFSSHLSTNDILNLEMVGCKDGIAIDANLYALKKEYFEWHYNNIFKK